MPYENQLIVLVNLVFSHRHILTYLYDIQSVVLRHLFFSSITE